MATALDAYFGGNEQAAAEWLAAFAEEHDYEPHEDPELLAAGMSPEDALEEHLKAKQWGESFAQGFGRAPTKEEYRYSQPQRWYGTADGQGKMASGYGNRPPEVRALGFPGAPSAPAAASSQAPFFALGNIGQGLANGMGGGGTGGAGEMSEFIRRMRMLQAENPGLGGLDLAKLMTMRRPSGPMRGIPLKGKTNFEDGSTGYSYDFPRGQVAGPGRNRMTVANDSPIGVPTDPDPPMGIPPAPPPTSGVGTPPVPGGGTNFVPPPADPHLGQNGPPPAGYMPGIPGGVVDTGGPYYPGGDPIFSAFPYQTGVVDGPPGGYAIGGGGPSMDTRYPPINPRNSIRRTGTLTPRQNFDVRWHPIQPPMTALPPTHGHDPINRPPRGLYPPSPRRTRRGGIPLPPQFPGLRRR